MDENVVSGQRSKRQIVVVESLHEDNQIFNIAVNEFVRLLDLLSLALDPGVKHVQKLPVEVIENRLDENLHA